LLSTVLRIVDLAERERQAGAARLAPYSPFGLSICHTVPRQRRFLLIAEWADLCIFLFFRGDINFSHFFCGLGVHVLAVQKIYQDISCGSASLKVGVLPCIFIDFTRCPPVAANMLFCLLILFSIAAGLLKL
jgi:hypothetical protein